jgi:hypothetical protein
MEEKEEAGERQDLMGVLLGKMAVERGFITAAQLRDALMEQGRDVEERKMARPLGLILTSKGYMSEQIVLTLLGEQRARNLDPERARRRDQLLGQILLKQGEITQEQLNECIRLQTQMVEDGQPEIPHLGELLVQKEYTTPRAVTLALASQKKVMLACAGCGKRYNATGYKPIKTYKCKACQGNLIPLSECDSIRVDAEVSLKTPTLGQPAVTDLYLTPVHSDPVREPTGKIPVVPGGAAVTSGAPVPPPAPPIARFVKVRRSWGPILWIAAAVILGLAAVAYLLTKFS